MNDVAKTEKNLATGEDAAAPAKPATKTQRMPDDLTLLDTRDGSEEGHVVYIEHPVEPRRMVAPDGSDLFVRILGPDSKAAINANKTGLNHILRKKRNRVDADDIEDQQFAVLVAITVDWNVWDNDQKTVSLSDENKLKAYENFPELRRQVQAAYEDIANFTKKPAKRS